MVDDDAVAKLTLADLIAWGRDWQRHLDTGPHDNISFHLPLALLARYVATANTALEREMQEAARKKPRSRGGRPAGGMGEQKLRLVAAGVREDDAERIVAKAFGKPLEAAARLGHRPQNRCARRRATNPGLRSARLQKTHLFCSGAHKKHPLLSQAGRRTPNRAYFRVDTRRNAMAKPHTASPNAPTPPPFDLDRSAGGAPDHRSLADVDLRRSNLPAADLNFRARPTTPASCWLRHEVEGWLQERIAERDADAARRRQEITARRERSLARKRGVTPKRRTKRKTTLLKPASVAAEATPSRK